MDHLIGLRLDVEALAYRLGNIRSDTDDLIIFRNYYKQDIIDAKNMCYDLHHRINNLRDDVGTFIQPIKDLQGDIKSIYQSINNINSWVKIIENLQTQIAELKNEISELKKKK
jgi:peptidoglycan hydrolase CwlO-like protein